MERTASLRINLDRSTEFPLGSFRCFACAEQGDWNILAKRLKLQRYKKRGNDDFDFEIADSVREQLLGPEAETSILKPEIQFSPRWPRKTRWRNIEPWLVRKLDGHAITTKFGSQRLYLPVKQDGDIIGGITCALSSKARTKYLYEKGKWIRSALFPFDYTKRLLRKSRRRVILLVEGPRDALNLLQHDVPALAILGGTSVWRRAKAELLLLLNPELIVLAFDPDKIGRQVTELARTDLRGQVPLKRLRFRTEVINGEKIKHDPGNLSPMRIARIKRQLGL